MAYGSYYTEAEYPVTKVLRETVYVEVNVLDRTDPNIVLTLGHCWTTNSPNPHSLPQWDILIDGYNLATLLSHFLHHVAGKIRCIFRLKSPEIFLEM